jgi:hypothetical protein
MSTLKLKDQYLALKRASGSFREFDGSLRRPVCSSLVTGTTAAERVKSAGEVVQRLDDPGMAELKRALRPPEEHISEWKPNEYEILNRVTKPRAEAETMEAQAAYDEQEMSDTEADEIKPPEFGSTQVPENMSGDGHWETLSEAERLEISDVLRKHNLQEALVPLVLDHVDTLWAATADHQDLTGLMAVLFEICELEFKERRNVLH